MRGLCWFIGACGFLVVSAVAWVFVALGVIVGAYAAITSSLLWGIGTSIGAWWCLRQVVDGFAARVAQAK